jgi:hypothetical protein
MIAANNGHLLAFDNLSGLPAWLSDALCRLGSGGSFAVRQLYTDDEEVLFKAARPTLLNGIEDIIGRQRLRRPGRLLPIAGGRPRAAAQFFVFPVGYLQGYVNLKGYEEFAAENRPAGWNTWVTLVISPAAPTPSAPTRRPLITK